MKKSVLKEFLFFCVFFAFCTVLKAQNVTGVVLDATTDEPLPGANVAILKTTTGTFTDANGKFSIAAKKGDILVFSYVGYTPKEIPVNGTEIKVSLESGRTLDEVVVVGYGTQKRKDLTGSVASVKGDDFKNQPVGSATEALQGRIAGVDIVKGSGEPGPAGKPKIIIRGVSSLNQPDPLYIIDGVRADENNVNVQDIESIDLLKDAAAAAIYGAAAAGGVIVITTKRGAGAKPTINFNARYGITEPKLVRLINKQEYIDLSNIIRPHIFKDKDPAGLDTLADTDWVDALFGNAHEENYNLSISGAANNINYYFSGFYNNQDGIYIRNYSKVGGFRVNSTYKVNNWLKITEQISGSTRKTAPPVGAEAQLHNAPFRSLPVMPIREKDGDYGGLPQGYNIGFGGANAIGTIEAAQAVNLDNTFQGNLLAEIILPANFTFRTNFGHSFYQGVYDTFQGTFDFGPVARKNNSLNKGFYQYRGLFSNYVLSYDKKIGNHNINVIAGYEEISSRTNEVQATKTFIGLPGFSFINTSQSENIINGRLDKNHLIRSKFGRINYNYNNKYYLSASIREDANYQKFGPGKQKGIFPAFSLGWNISDEEFFKPLLNTFDLLKFRGSYGELGNSQIPSYTFNSTYSQAGGQAFSPGGSVEIANTINRLPNLAIHWETVKEYNLALDGEAFKRKLYFTVEWYKKLTEDMLYPLPLAPSTGVGAPYLTNIGGVTSEGLDLLVGYRNTIGKVNYEVSVTGGHNSNVVNSLTGASTDRLLDGFNYYSNGDAGFSVQSGQTLTITEAGLPFGSFYGYKVVGTFQTDEEAKTSAQPNAKAGDLIFYHNPDNGPTLNDKDRQVIGNPNPKFVYGSTIKVGYAGFDVSILLNGVAGVDIYNGVKAYEMYPFADGVPSSKVFGASFLGENGITRQPRLGVVNADGSFSLDPNGNYTKVNSFFVEKGDYVKLKNLQIGYTFNSNLLKKLTLNSLRLYLTGSNLLTITKYSGLDPEIGSAASGKGYQAGTTTRGIDAVSKYPQTRIFSAGIDINL